MNGENKEYTKDALRTTSKYLFECKNSFEDFLSLRDKMFELTESKNKTNAEKLGFVTASLHVMVFSNEGKCTNTVYFNMNDLILISAFLRNKESIIKEGEEEKFLTQNLQELFIDNFDGKSTMYVTFLLDITNENHDFVDVASISSVSKDFLNFLKDIPNIILKNAYVLVESMLRLPETLQLM